MRVLFWLLLAINGGGSGHDGLEATDRLIPPGWQGNPWGPAANLARKEGRLPTISDTPLMTQWDQWGRKVLKEGDIVFRRGDARILGGWFPFSRFIANISGSQYSHVGTVAIEDGEPYVYDTTKASVRRQPFKVWVLDNTGPFGVKRLKPEHRGKIPKVMEYLHQVYEQQVPFDYELSLDDRALYCVEMAEKAFRHAGLKLSEPVILANMENINQFPICVFGFTSLTNLTLDMAVYFPGNERHGIWGSPLLEQVYPPAPTAARPAPPSAKPAAPAASSVARRSAAPSAAAPSPPRE
ncbi:YiiX/YebB-like N1pC/P60 family cysteine hydrolase [Tundrisphaera sp. TA3]|uniref:YiiX/YebB-like N1pC/P60 family cysteine hydrolase n=1 Tax=Tundrisphaera sp. TA3 TaxID=3435775 RepID=UPI003EB9D192